jgi:hypothetical protein
MEQDCDPDIHSNGHTRAIGAGHNGIHHAYDK